MKSHSFAVSPCRAVLLFLFALSVSSLAIAEESFDPLIEQIRRPTISQVIEASGGAIPQQNPFDFVSASSLNRNNGNTRSIRYPDSSEGIRQFVWSLLPRALARLERSFPGATWGALGRDASFMGDAIDAFYHSIGQKDRVVRIDISTGSFSRDPQINLDYYSSLGAPTDPASLEKAPYPWIVFDRTSFGGVRQSASLTIVQEIYAHFLQAGGNPIDLIHKVNAISTNPGNGDWQNGPYIERFADVSVEAFLKQQAEEAKERGRPLKVLAIDANLTDSSEWHNTFGVLTRTADGSVVSVPGQKFARDNALRVLWEQGELLQTVRDPEFLKKVQQEAHEIGYEFPLKRTTELTFVKSDQAGCPDVFAP